MKDCTTTETWVLAQDKTRKTIQEIKYARIASYESNPNVCKSCGVVLPYTKRMNMYCGHSCSAKQNNIGVRRHGEKISDRICVECGLVLNTRNDKFCSNECCGKHTAKQNIVLWKTNPDKYKTLPSGVRIHLLESTNNSCSLCGWSKMNPISKTYPLVIDHIDGNAENNHPDNLRVLCPNCDSLTPTYKALNKGNGRANRRQRYRDGKSY